MAVKTRNIIVGAANLWYAGFSAASDGTLTPALPTFDAASDGTSLVQDFDDDANWTALGATQEGVEVAYEPDYGEIVVDQLKDAAKLFNQGLTVTVSTNLAEATLQNLLVAWGVDDAALSGNTFEVAVPGDTPVERQLAFVGNAPTDESGNEFERLYHCYRCISIEGSTHGLRRTEATVFPVTFRLLAVPEKTVSINGKNYAKYADVIDHQLNTA